MILRLTEQLDVPLRDRNALLLAGGYAPAYPERRLDEPELAAVRAALRHVLAGHDALPGHRGQPLVGACRRQRGRRGC